MKLGPSERDIARAVVTELQRHGYETYEEVSMGYASQRADIVAVRGPVVAVVECKTSLSVRLLDQLTRWLGSAHLVIGAVKHIRRSVTIERYARREGFGLWSVCGDEIAERVAPRLFRRAAVASLRRVLMPEQRSGDYAQAGSQSGGYFTPFRRTCRDLHCLVKAHPGISLRDAIKALDHHYASDKSAVSAIPELIRRGVITDLRAEGVPLCLYPVDRSGDYDARA